MGSNSRSKVSRSDFSHSLSSTFLPPFSSLFQETGTLPSGRAWGDMRDKARRTPGSLGFLIALCVGTPFGHSHHPSLSLSLRLCLHLRRASSFWRQRGLSVWFKAACDHTGEKGVKAGCQDQRGKFRRPTLKWNGQTREGRAVWDGSVGRVGWGACQSKLHLQRRSASTGKPRSPVPTPRQGLTFLPTPRPRVGRSHPRPVGGWR